MKKILSLLLVLLTCLSLSACMKEDIENPVKEYSSLEEINSKAGVYLVTPGVMGKSNEKYFMLDNNTAAYSYDLNGYNYYMRGTKFVAEDMSGIFKDGKLLFSGNQDQVAYGEAEGYKVYRFFLGSRQYIFGVNDNGTLDKETFDAQFLEIYNQIMYDASFEEIKNLIGTYQDSTSQRASMNISLSEVNQLLIDITWSSSATEYDEWIMNARVNDSKAVYDSVAHYLVVTLEDGTLDSQTLGDYQAGYFEIKDGKLLWSGSGDELTSSCVFEKVD